jgi:DNA (cytosine-5)-methyltransferase 1
VTAYYNEHDPFAAAWLRELIKDNLIAPGEVDERSIEDVTPNDLRPFQQCHFFAGIGVWSLAARLEGVPDDTPLWTGSCPCQPFSAAGKGEGFADERHLWPAFHYLIEQCRPSLVAGEQVAGADGDTWLDLVSSDLDATGYAFGSAETCAAGFGAPHIRTRNYWVAYRLGARLEGFAGHVIDGNEPGRVRALALGSTAAGGLPHRVADAEYDDGRADEQERRQDRGTADGGVRSSMRVDDTVGLGRSPGRDDHGSDDGDQSHATDEDGAERVADLHGDGRDQRRVGVAAAGHDGPERDGASGWMAHADTGIGEQLARQGAGPFQAEGRRTFDQLAGRSHAVGGGRPGPVNGLWGDADWLYCRDEKWRPVEPGTFPLVDAGTFRNRVGLLRGAGNAINVAQAQGFYRAVIASLKG